jgi:hypothetical protein
VLFCSIFILNNDIKISFFGLSSSDSLGVLPPILSQNMVLPQSKVFESVLPQNMTLPQNEVFRIVLPQHEVLELF